MSGVCRERKRIIKIIKRLWGNYICWYKYKDVGVKFQTKKEILKLRISFSYQCGRGDLNSHRIKLPLEPESSASAIPPLPLDKWYFIIRKDVCKVLNLYLYSVFSCLFLYDQPGDSQNFMKTEWFTFDLGSLRSVDRWKMNVYCKIFIVWYD